jgi:hypothetical protein
MKRLAAWWSAWGEAPAADRVGAALAVAACALAFVVGSWGFLAPFPEGHYASDAAIGMAADNMWRLHTKLPVIGYQTLTPGPGNYYMHHPLGVFWVTALLGRVFGFHDWVPRLPAVVYVTATPAFLYLIGRELWGRLPGGLAAVGYVSLPITIGFANFHDLEQPVMFGCVIATWGCLRYLATWRERYAIVSVLAFAFAAFNDWEAYVWGAFLLGGLFVRGYLIPGRWLAPLDARRFGRYWGLLCAAAVAALGVEVLVLDESGRVSDLLSSFFVRSAGAGVPLKVVLASRQYRIELMFTGLGIFLGKVALPVMFARAFLRRDERELAPLPLFGAALVQYVVFKQGADVHIFWPHPFAAYFALAVGALAASVRDGWTWLAAHVRRLPDASRPRWVAASPFIALVLSGLPVALVLKDGLALFRLARETGGRFAEANLESDLDKAAAFRWFLPRVPPGATFAFHGSVHDYWDKQWQLRPRPIFANQPVGGSPAQGRFYVMDSRLASAADLKAAAARYHVNAVGWIWLIDRTEPAAPIDGFAVDESDPSFFQAWAHGSTEPIRKVRADAWVTWEWRSLFGQAAAPPAGTPGTTDDLRIAHNAALARGDAAGAAAARAALAQRFNLPLRARYDNGTELIGAIDHRTGQRSLTLYFVAGKFHTDARFAVHAKVQARPRWSTLPADPADLEIYGAPALPTTLWRPGHIYAIRIVYRRRPGPERYTGAWVNGPRREGDPAPLELARM